MKQPTLRQLMVKGSTWRLTQDVRIDGIDNWNVWYPAVCALNVDFEEAKKILADRGITRTVSVDLKKGDEFLVTGKMKNSYYNEDGLCVPIKVNDKVIPTASFKLLSKSVEAVDIPVVYQYVLRDTSTGLFYAIMRHVAKMGYGNYGYTGIPEYASTFMKAKRFEDMGKLKQHILGFTGYYAGMENGRPEYYGDSDIFQADLPKTWEVVKFDKIAKREVEIIDIQDWFSRTMRLRPLTIAFGSPVRKLYNDLEKRDELEKFTGMLVIRANGENELSRDDIATFKALPVEMGISKKESRFAKDDYCAAATFVDWEQAVMAKLQYSGNTVMNVIDLKTMREVIE